MSVVMESIVRYITKTDLERHDYHFKVDIIEKWKKVGARKLVPRPTLLFLRLTALDTLPLSLPCVRQATRAVLPVCGVADRKGVDTGVGSE